MIPLVVYETADDGSAQIAEVVAATLRAPALAAVDARPGDLEDADLLILGSPTRYRSHGAALRELLDSIDEGWLIGIRTATFDSRPKRPAFRTGSAARTLARRARDLGAELIIQPRSFFLGPDGLLLAGELEQAAQWALEVARAIGADVAVTAPTPPMEPGELSAHQYPEPLLTPLVLQGGPRLGRPARENGRARRRSRTRA